MSLDISTMVNQLLGNNSINIQVKTTLITENDANFLPIPLYARKNKGTLKEKYNIACHDFPATLGNNPTI
jgi:hypothetical protein